MRALHESDRFNEAAGETRQKLLVANARVAGWGRFNEAAGETRRKREHHHIHAILWLASMRPPEFTGGNWRAGPRTADPLPASMRPPEFTGGNPWWQCRAYLRVGFPASMRPPEFTGGNASFNATGGRAEQMLQ